MAKTLNGHWFSNKLTIGITTLIIGAIFSHVVCANEEKLNLNYKGHIKYQSLLATYPDNSFYLNTSDDPAWDNNFDTRHNFSIDKNTWSAQIDYQLLIKSGDTIESRNQLSGIDSLTPITPSDEQRIMDLTHLISEDNDTIIAHRLDRLYYDFNTEKNVFRIGRQAVSWGNGLMYNPMDFFNPFDPTAVDKEYKTGDDMLYAQHLFDNGSDIQLVWVGRRNSTDNISQEVSSLAIKYHYFIDDSEIDILLAQHFNDTTVAIGAVANLADAIIRGDLVVTNLTQTNKIVVSSVLNTTYSWTLWSKNMSAVLEYYHNGFGINDIDYGPRALANRTELIERLQRGELFTLAQDYFAASLTIELSPLWIVTPNIFWNLNDSSNFVQIISQYDVKQNIQLLAALNIPVGDPGTEFGGIESGVPNQPLSIDATATAQLAWYF